MSQMYRYWSYLVKFNIKHFLVSVCGVCRSAGIIVIMQGRILHGFDWCTWHQRFTWLTPQFSLALSYLRLLQFCLRHPCPCSSHDFSLFWVYLIRVLLLIKWWKVLHLKQSFIQSTLACFCLLRIQLLLFPHTSCGLLLLLLCTIMIMTIFSTRQYC